jgi:hypothetical protein
LSVNSGRYCFITSTPGRQRFEAQQEEKPAAEKVEEDGPLRLRGLFGVRTQKVDRQLVGQVRILFITISAKKHMNRPGGVV